ncbi:MAG: hypothetical protein K2Y26_05020 [Gemmatimonadaceae bacterium]|uniref:hypothetical protein n=1 Tax=Gemmatimonas sp. UBA7669 TaxID=1946568 RepID=UPI0025BC2F1E|nr:hypothetical protein [Gemmatimonas sp. UBA7669]MBX9854861.1 hypothetical protein [Gemmatimonadaceae bacterium]
MDRRQFCLTAGAAAVAGTAPAAALPSQSKPVASGMTQEAARRQAVIAACHDCRSSGAACLTMCNEMLRKGMTAFADCQARVIEMLTMCDAMGAMAGTNTFPVSRLKALAGICAETCRDCERACRPLAAHAECKACMDDAADCARACEAYKL